MNSMPSTGMGTKGQLVHATNHHYTNTTQVRKRRASVRHRGEPGFSISPQFATKSRAMNNVDPTSSNQYATNFDRSCENLLLRTSLLWIELPSIKPIVHKSSNNHTTNFKPRPEPESHQLPVTTTAHRLESTRPPSILTAVREPKTRTHNRQTQPQMPMSVNCAWQAFAEQRWFPFTPDASSESVRTFPNYFGAVTHHFPKFKKTLRQGLHRWQRLQSGNKFGSRGMTLSMFSTQISLPCFGRSPE